MKIACLIDTVSRNAGGLNTSVRRLMQSLAELGDEVKIFTIGDSRTVEDLPDWAPLSVFVGRPFGPRRFGFSASLRREFAMFEPDLVMTHGLWTFTSWISLRWHKKFGGKYLVNPHGMLDPWAVKNSAWKKRIAGFFFEYEHLQKASCLRLLCKSEEESVRSFGLKNPVAIVPNAIDVPDQGMISSILARDHRVKELQKKSKVLLYLGRIHPKKGLADLLRGWASLQKQSEPGEWILALAGWDEGGHERFLKDLTRKLSVADSVVFLGPQFNEELAACYANCDAFILPSLSEGLPMVVLEAWAYGKPVVMTPMCNLPEGFASGAAIEILPTRESIAEGLQKLFKLSSTDRTAVGARGRALVLSTFTWRKVARDLQSVNEWLVNLAPEPACVQHAG